MFLAGCNDEAAPVAKAALAMLEQAWMTILTVGPDTLAAYHKSLLPPELARAAIDFGFP